MIELEIKHYLANSQNKDLAKLRNKFLQPFSNQRKNIHEITQKGFCKAILDCQNDNMIMKLEFFVTLSKKHLPFSI